MPNTSIASLPQRLIVKNFITHIYQGTVLEHGESLSQPLSSRFAHFDFSVIRIGDLCVDQPDGWAAPTEMVEGRLGCFC